MPVRLVPGLADVMEGRAQRGEMREITMEDLLAREPMDVDEDACRATIAGRVVLITGAAGSIGAELTRRVFAYGPAALHLVDTNETGLHELRVELTQKAAERRRSSPGCAASPTARSWTTSSRRRGRRWSSTSPPTSTSA